MSFGMSNVEAARFAVSAVSVKAFHGGENYGLAEWRNGHRRARLLLRAQR